MIKLSDFIVDYLYNYGIRHVFMVTGGGAMHLNDSFAFYQGLKCIYHHHEQACAIAAEGYARTSGNLAVVNVTTGPGGLNTLTGLMGQWTDSVPVLYISGQVKYETTIQCCPELKLRQLGDQEVDIISVVKPLTKFAETILDPYEIRLILDKAIYYATSGRPGPVWINIPMNIQSYMLDENKIKNSEIECYKTKENKENLVKDFEKIIELINNSKRPVIVAGHGIRLSKSIDLFLQTIEILKIPVLSTFNGFDIITSDNKYFMGRIGTLGNRCGNFVLQNADLVIFIGTRNNIRQISYSWNFYCREAIKVGIDIDNAELNKPTIKLDYKINTDAKIFIEYLYKNHHKINNSNLINWYEWCNKRKEKYLFNLKEYKIHNDSVNPYRFTYYLSKLLPEKAIVVTANATPNIAYFQTGIVKKGQRVIWNSGCASMGYDLPAAIGACFANNTEEVVCLAGDGSFQMNIQELATISFYKLPIKIFYFDNNGYSSIKQTQDNFFKRRAGVDNKTGLFFPAIDIIAKAYNIKYYEIKNEDNIEKNIKQVLDFKGPVICRLKLPENYEFSPKLSSEKKPDGSIVSKPLEDLYPFLDREEFKENMIIPIIEE